jgi:hypothetical protein
MDRNKGIKGNAVSLGKELKRLGFNRKPKKVDGCPRYVWEVVEKTKEEMKKEATSDEVFW